MFQIKVIFTDAHQIFWIQPHKIKIRVIIMISMFKRFKVIFEEALFRTQYSTNGGNSPQRSNQLLAVSFHLITLVSSKYSSGKSPRNNIFKEGLNALTLDTQLPEVNHNTIIAKFLVKKNQNIHLTGYLLSCIWWCWIKPLVLNYAEKVQLIHISFLRQPKVRFRVSSNEGNLLRSEKINKENQYRFALGCMCMVSQFKPIMHW